jgi:hypothetical protein
MDDDEPTSRYRSRIYEWFRARYELAPVFATGFCARVSVLQLWLSGADCFALSAAGAGQAGEDGCRSSSARIAYKERVFSVQNDAFHLPFTDVVIDWYCAIGTEDRIRVVGVRGSATRLWGNPTNILVKFAMTGDPNSQGLPKWPAFDPGSDYVLSLGQKIGPFPMNQKLRVLDKIMAQILSEEPPHRN